MKINDYQMDGHKLYWHLDRVAAWQSGQLIAPIYVELSPVSYCNHHCVFCGLDFAQEERINLDTSATCRSLQEMARLGIKSVMFAGEGEPLLHSGLAEMVCTARASGLDVSITTNGSLGTADLWHELIPSLSWLRFSVDAGSSETYATVHGVGRSAFNATLESIKQALAERDATKSSCTVGVQFLLIRDNLADLENAIQLFGGLGVDYLSLKPYSKHPQMLSKSDFTYTDESIATIDAIIKRYQNAFKKTRIIFRRAATDIYAAGNKTFKHCYALPFWGYISSKGDFYTCSVFLNDERFKIGNIFTEPLESILFGERRRRSIEYACRDLLVDDVCRINCRMARINEFLELLCNKPEHVNFI
jgi:radical SAM protein with 4Fe4S-binding SPASM domain